MDDLLRSLASGPVPALAPAEAVRRRGDQRRRRTRAAVAGASAAVVLAVGGIAVAVTDEATGRPDSLVPATSGPTPSEPTFAPPEPIDTSRLVSPAALLPPSEAAAIEPGEWVGAGGDPDSSVRLMACEQPREPLALGGYSGTLTRGGPSDMDVVHQQVLRFGSTALAGEALDQVRADVVRCPRRAADSEDGTGYAENRLLPLSGGAVGVAQRAADCARCASGTRYWAVVAEGPYVGYLSVSRDARLQTWADAVRERLRACAATACPDLELPEDIDLPGQALLAEGERLWAVTIGAEPADAPASDTANEQARLNAQLLGYLTRVVTASCLRGAIDPGATMPQTARLVAVAFASQQAASAFRESYRRTLGQAGEPNQVMVACLD